MLRELHVRDLGVLREAEVSFAPGLNVVTGETGAGKTLLITSLALLAGMRAESRLVAQGAAEASVEAVLEVPAGHRASGDGTVDEDGVLIAARRVSADGPSRAWLGGRLVPIAVLGEACGGLLEVHGQRDAFALARPRAQLEALDALAGTAATLAAYRTALGHVRDLRAERERIEADVRTRDRERELLAFQVEEIDRAGLAPGEEDELTTEIGRLEHAERLSHTGARTAELAGSEGAAGGLAEAHKELEDAARLDPSLGPLVSRIAALAAEAAEAAWDVRAWAEGLEPDPSRLAALRERSGLLGHLKRKYGVSIPDILAVADAARERLAELDGAGERAAEISGDLTETEARLDELAAELSGRRRAAAGELTELVRKELPHLALAQADFRAEIEDAGGDAEHGRDAARFLFSAHPSRRPDLLGKVASGGELSRAMIAVTLALAQVHAVPVLVFDEADAGVGGEAALDLARRLSRLGRTHQVLVVSHLPQIAAFADRHIAVRRDGVTVHVEAIDEDDRLAEISRMLAGLGSSDLARAHAAELVELASGERAAQPARAS